MFSTQNHSLNKIQCFNAYTMRRIIKKNTCGQYRKATLPKKYWGCNKLTQKAATAKHRRNRLIGNFIDSFDIYILKLQPAICYYIL